MVSIIIYYCNIMGPPSYMQSVVDRNIVMRRMTVLLCGFIFFALWWYGDYNTSNYNIVIIYDLSLLKKKRAYKQEFRSQLYAKLGLIWTFANKIFRLLLTAVEESW